jgi:hypothetical protein
VKKVNLLLILGLVFTCTHFAGCGSGKPELTKEETAIQLKAMEKEVNDGESKL